MQLGPTLITNGGYSSPNGTLVNVSGRITAIVTHPNDANTIYMTG